MELRIVYDGSVCQFAGLLAGWLVRVDRFGAGEWVVLGGGCEEEVE